MRVISGDLKGKKLLIPLDKSTRPLKDLVRESIFNILDHSPKVSIELKNSKVLDLFSGTGSFGIECLSRGAAEVSFFENYNNSLKILKLNIFSLKLEDKSTIFNYSAYNLNDSKLKDKILDSMKEYIGKTYSKHYSNKIQTLDLIDSVGDASAFCRSNILKYASRYDKKGTAKLDIQKIIHYAVLLYHFEELDKDS